MELIRLHEKAIKQLEMLKEADLRIASQQESQKNFTDLFGSPLESTNRRIERLERIKPRIEKSYFATLHQINNVALFQTF